METYNGKSVCKGTAIGKLHIVINPTQAVLETHVEDIDTQKRKLQEAIATGKEQLQLLYKKAIDEVGKDTASIFEIHQMLMEDGEFLKSIEEKMETERVTAAYAVSIVKEQFASRFLQMDDAYMRERGADIQDVGERLIRILLGKDDNRMDMSEPRIVVAEDLSPSDTIAMDASKILALITTGGSVTGHTAILARMMNIPALVGCDQLELSKLTPNQMGIVYGEEGRFVVDPTQKECDRANKMMQDERERHASMEALKGKDNVTKSGKKIEIYANIGHVQDVDVVLANDAGGIGLFRSEFLYLGRDTLPSEEEQYQAYLQVAQKLDGRPVIIRTLDIGADKQVAYLNQKTQENPALGNRAIRLCFEKPELFESQLRALLRASVCENLRIMYPMITSVWEVEWIQQIVAKVARKLQEEGVSYRIPSQGIMIETPAAVMISDELAKMVDFFSIGTNDLTQYTLAADRQNDALGDYYDPHHKAIGRMIEMVVAAGHKAGISVGICGELGADPTMLSKWIEMGLDEISVSPSCILKLRKNVRELE